MHVENGARSDGEDKVRVSGVELRGETMDFRVKLRGRGGVVPWLNASRQRR